LVPELVPESRAPKKSKAVAVILAAIFGPLGLLYLGMEGLMVVILVIGIGFFALPLVMGAAHQVNGFGLLISLLGRALSVWWAVKTVARQNLDSGASDASAEADALLDQAVKLEGVDMAQAVTKYEELIANYPGSSASRSARNCLNTIRSHQNTAITD
jgi:hypothetical protein